MPSPNPALTPQAIQALSDLGRSIQGQRKSLKISAVAAAEAAGISRVTLHRIEKGEPSVTAGAYAAVCVALRLKIEAAPHEARVQPIAPDRKGWIPARVRIADYPRLKELAWQVHGLAELSPREALDVYQRNWRHLEQESLSQDESELIDALRQGLEGDPGV